MDKILVISDFPDVQYRKDSGTPALRLIIESLAKKYEVHILTSVGGKDRDSETIKYFRSSTVLSNNPVLRKLNLFAFLRNRYYYGKLLNELYHYKLFYGAGALGTHVAGQLGKNLSTPSVGRLFGTYLYPYLGRMSILIKAEELLAFNAPCTKFIITNDGTGGDKVADYFKIPREKVYFWRNGVELPPESKKMDEKTHVISLARLEKWKHVERIIMAFSEVVKDDPNLTLDIVGGGPECKFLRYLANDVCLQDTITFHGEVTRTRALELLSQADIFVSANDYSNISNSLLEAMSAGKGIVALDTGMTQELLLDKGYLAKDQVDLANGIRKLNIPFVREFLGTKSKEYANQHFDTWERRINRETELCDRLITGDLS